MSIRSVASVVALAACTVAPLTSSAASLFGRSAGRGDLPTSAQSVKGKSVKLTLKNKTAAPMTLVVNDSPVIIGANDETSVKALVGSNIYSEDKSMVKLHVTSDLSGNTVSFR